MCGESKLGDPFCSSLGPAKGGCSQTSGRGGASAALGMLGPKPCLGVPSAPTSRAPHELSLQNVRSGHPLEPASRDARFQDSL